MVAVAEMRKDLAPYLIEERGIYTTREMHPVKREFWLDHGSTRSSES